jgi:two-component system nitrate/nitrite response regulator NarL
MFSVAEVPGSEMQKNTKVTIAVVDDHPIVRQGLVAVLGQEAEFTIVAEGKNAGEAINIAELHRPDLMILDLDIPGSGLEALRQISAKHPETRCIILTVCDRPEIAIEALNSGAKGYILKGVGSSELKKAVHTVVNDESFVSPEFAARLLTSSHSKKEPVSEKLSYREKQVIREVERGLTNKQIAINLKLSEKTVKYYMSTLMQKLEVTNRVSAVMATQKRREDNTEQPK